MAAAMRRPNGPAGRSAATRGGAALHGR
jgi:hypothetical protein